MDVDDDFGFDDQVAIEELGMDALGDANFAGSDDLVEYSSGEEGSIELDVGYTKAEDIEESISKNLITSPTITVRRVVKPAAAAPATVTTATTTPTLQKIAPKPATLIRATNSAGKVVLIQKQPTTSGGGGVVNPVKLLNSTTKTSPGGITSTTSYHLIKSEDGVVMRPKVTSAAAAPQTTVVRRVISTLVDKPKPMTTAAPVKTPTHVVIHTKTGTSGGTTTKTVTMAEAQQMGLLGSNKVKQVVMTKSPASLQPKSPVKLVTTAAGGSSGSSSVVRMKQSPGAPGSAGPQATTQKMLIKTSSGVPGRSLIQSQKVLMPQSAIQAGQQSGQIQAINIPGKGIQYVRFLNQNSAGGSSSPAGATASIKTIGGHKVVQINKNAVGGAAAPPGSKIIVRDNKTYVVSNGNVVRTVNSGTQQPARVVASGSQTMVRKTIIPAGRPQLGTIKKESDSTHYIAVVKKEDGKSTETIKTLTAAQYAALKGTTVMTGGSKTKIVMLPSGSSVVKQEHASNPPAIISVKRESVSGSEDEMRKGPAVGTIFPDEAYKKRPCNCTKSQCLKLYCDCFANGEFCYNCNCRDCYNNLDNEEERQKAIRATLERNPSAFKPKIGAVSAAEDALRQHTKGCNCKRSNCLKNYCECYEGKIACSANCKCIGCRNTEQYVRDYEYHSGAGSSLALDSIVGGATAGEAAGEYSGNDSSMADHSANATGLSLDAGPASAAGEGTSTAVAGVKRKLATAAAVAEPDLTQLPPSKQPYNFMTPDVIEATVQCMIAQADECQKRGCNIRTAERMILEEFGRCLVEIIDFSSKSDS